MNKIVNILRLFLHDAWHYNDGRHHWHTVHWRERGRACRKDYCSCGYNA